MRLRIVEEARSYEADLSGPVVLGRQKLGAPNANEGGPFWTATEAGQPVRVVVAWNSEDHAFSREHCRLEPLPDGRVRVANLSANFPLQVGRDGAETVIPERGALDLPIPFTIHLERRTILVSDPDADGGGLLRLAQQTLAPGRRAAALLYPPPALDGPQLEQVVAWMQTTVGVLQGAVGSTDFLQRAAETLVEIVGLDWGRVLLKRDDQWDTEAVHPAPPDDSAWRPSDTVMEGMLQGKRTVLERLASGPAAGVPSLWGLQMVVAAPLLNADGEVIGALYGEQQPDGAGAGRQAGKLEAMLVEILAGGVAAGLARQRQEREAARNQTLFEQFFTAPLAAQLRDHPDMLDPQTRTVTVLFCDVRGFSGISEKLGPADSLRWMNDVMYELSDLVLKKEGVLVDYVGDEVMAMWGAPVDQPDQAERAAHTALKMLAALPAVNARWQHALKGSPTAIAVGVSTGPAQVGNTGSRFKYKYGPLGHTVNLGSRVQGLTKYLKRPLLVTGDARERLGADFIARRVVQARVVNMRDPVDVYEVEAAAGPGLAMRRQFFAESEAALDDLEERRFTHAASRAGRLLLDRPDDGVLLLLLSRASKALIEDGRDFDKVWTPPGK